MILNVIRNTLINRNLRFSHLNSISLSIIVREMRFAANISTLFEDIPNHVQSYKEVAKRFVNSDRLLNLF